MIDRKTMETMVASVVRTRMTKFGHGYKPGLYEAAHDVGARFALTERDRKSFADALEAVVVEHEIRKGDQE